MLTQRIIPCLDVSDGRVVKGIKFQSLRDAGDPVERALAYQEQGADEIVVLDISATPEGRGHQREVVAGIREALMVPLTVGGGVRTLEDAEGLLDAGADKVSMNTAALANPPLLDEMAQRFGVQCTILAIDARRRGDNWEVLVRSGRDTVGRDAIDWAKEAADRGAGEILLTSWDRDGTLSGYDLDLLKAAREAVPVPIIASGGAAGVPHLLEAFELGIDAVLAASIFHDGQTTVGAVKRELAAAGIEVRQ